MDIRQVRRRQQADAAARRANAAMLAAAMSREPACRNSLMDALDEDVAVCEAADWCCEDGEVTEGSEHSADCPEFAAG